MDTYDWLKLLGCWAAISAVGFTLTGLNDSKPRLGRFLIAAAWIGAGSWLILAGVKDINRAWHHRGAGVVYFELGHETVSESSYKRNKYIGAALLIGLGMVFISGPLYLAKRRVSPLLTSPP